MTTEREHIAGASPGALEEAKGARGTLKLRPH